MPDRFFPRVTLAPLDDPRIEAFVNQYAKEKASQSLEYLYRQTGHEHANRKLLVLASNPFFLTCICNLFVLDKDPPALRGKLIQLLVKALYNREKKRANDNGFDYDTIVNAYALVAFKMLVRNISDSVPINWVMKQLKNQPHIGDIFDIGISADLVMLDKSTQYVRFKHRILQEYFSAEYIHRNVDDIRKYLTAPKIQDNKRKRMPLDGAISLLVDFEKPDKYLTQIMEKDPFLAAEIVFDLYENVGINTKNMLAQRVVNFLESKNTSVRDKAVNVLVLLDEVSTQPLRALFGSPHAWQRRRALEVLSQIRNIDALQCIILALDDRNRWVRRDAERIINFPDKELRCLIVEYVDKILSTREENEKRRVGESLVRFIDTDDEELLQILVSRTGVNIVESEANIIEEQVYREAIEEKEEYAEWDFVYRDTRETVRSDRDIVRRAQKWLWGAPTNHPSWPYAWATLWSEDPKNADLRTMGLCWLSGAPAGHRGWPFVWTALWREKTGDDELYRLGRRWLDIAGPDHSGWGFVWSSLCEKSQERSDLRKIGIEWIREANIENVSLGVVWLSIWRSEPGNKELGSIGRSWLKTTSKDNSLWGYVLPALCLGNKGDRELLTLGYSWMKNANVEYGAWGHIWTALWHSNLGDIELSKFGRMWLEKAAPSHGAWAYIWIALFKYSPNDAELAKQGMKWLSRAPSEHGGLVYVWEALWEAKYEDKELLRWCIDWFRETSPNHRGWGYFWEYLWEKQISKEEINRDFLYVIGKKWLTIAQPSHGSWGYIFPLVYEAAPDNEEIEQLGMKWLRNADPNFYGWRYVWKCLWEKSDKQIELTSLCLQWLKKVKPENVSWSYTWQTLWEKNPGDKELISVACEYLKKTPLDKENWYHVWKNLESYQSDRPDVVETGIYCLRHLDVSSEYRERIFNSISAHTELPTDVELLKGRIDKTPRLLIPNTDEGSKQLRVMLDNSINRSDVADTIVNWLMGDTRHLKQWPFLWKDVCDEFEDIDRLISIGKEWLSLYDINTPGWALVWSGVMSLGTKEDGPIQLGWHWMKRDYWRRSSWPIVWKALWDFEVDSRNELAELAVKWITSQGPARKLAGVVWLTLWSAGIRNSELLAWGLNFHKTMKNDESWARVDMLLSNI